MCCVCVPLFVCSEIVFLFRDGANVTIRKKRAHFTFRTFVFMIFAVERRCTPLGVFREEKKISVALSLSFYFAPVLGGVIVPPD